MNITASKNSLRNQEYDSLRKAISELRGEEVSVKVIKQSDQEITDANIRDFMGFVTEKELTLREKFFNLLKSIKELSVNLFYNALEFNDKYSK